MVLITLSSLVVRFDERRLERAAERGDQDAEERLERAWPPASRDNAIIGLAMLGAPIIGLFAVWFHFFRTRSRARKNLLLLRLGWRASVGLLWVFLIMAVNAAVVITLASLLGLPLEE